MPWYFLNWAMWYSWRSPVWEKLCCIYALILLYPAFPFKESLGEYGVTMTSLEAVECYSILDPALIMEHEIQIDQAEYKINPAD